MYKERHERMIEDLYLNSESQLVFNDEEHFYMNKIAFYLYRYKSEKVTFQNFLARLDIL